MLYRCVRTVLQAGLSEEKPELEAGTQRTSAAFLASSRVEAKGKENGHRQKLDGDKISRKAPTDHLSEFQT